MKVAVVVHDRDTAALVRAEIRSSGHEALDCVSVERALDVEPALIFTEWRGGEHLSALLRGLQAAAQRTPPTPVVILVPSGAVTARGRLRAEGAADVLSLPADAEEVRAEIREFCSEAAPPDGAELDRLRKITAASMIGESPAFLRCIEEMCLAARGEANILLVGETGTGKEEFARAIHALSHRRDSPFLAVNCAALSENLLESELFGHAKGAFTGADIARKGRFEAVGAGSLLLDEIGDLAIDLQVKLLRAIEQRCFQRLGENDDVRFNGRLICATSVDLDQAVAEKRFRLDLLGRVKQFPITLPPLRERRMDIPILARHFLRKQARGRSVQLSRSTLDVLESCDFPMNLRGLNNALSYAVSHCEGSLILPKHLPPDLSAAQAPGSTPAQRTIRVPLGLSYKDTCERARREIDRMMLPQLYEKHGRSDAQAAKEAGINRETFSQRRKDAELGGGDKTDGFL